MSVPTTGPGDGGSLLPVPSRLLGLATVALGLVLVAWDVLTDFFESS